MALHQSGKVQRFFPLQKFPELIPPLYYIRDRQRRNPLHPPYLTIWARCGRVDERIPAGCSSYFLSYVEDENAPSFAPCLLCRRFLPIDRLSSGLWALEGSPTAPV